MTPGQARHGTVSGYKYHGCRCVECRAATVRYEKGRRWLIHCGVAPTVPALGFIRRVHSLMAIGWTQKEIAAELGIAQGNLALKLRTNVTVRRATHVAMSEVYERLCMTRRDGVIAGRTARIAAKNGWSSPLSWDDIDADAAPNLGGHDRDVDPVAIDRVLAGDRVPTTRAERVEIARRWVASGRTLNALERLTGWEPARYYRIKDAA